MTRIQHYSSFTNNDDNNSNDVNNIIVCFTTILQNSCNNDYMQILEEQNAAHVRYDKIIYHRT